MKGKVLINTSIDLGLVNWFWNTNLATCIINTIFQQSTRVPSFNILYNNLFFITVQPPKFIIEWWVVSCWLISDKQFIFVFLLYYYYQVLVSYRVIIYVCVCVRVCVLFSFRLLFLVVFYQYVWLIRVWTERLFWSCYKHSGVVSYFVDYYYY